MTCRARASTQKTPNWPGRSGLGATGAALCVPSPLPPAKLNLTAPAPLFLLALLFPAACQL